MSKEYVSSQLIKKFSKNNGVFNFGKLNSLLVELNDNYKRKNVYSCAMIIRAILDHIPPLLGYSNFNEVVENYPWGKTDKAIMTSLQDFKLDAHDILHRPISDKHFELGFEDIPKPRRLLVLLTECTDKWKEKGRLLSKKSPKERLNINVSLRENEISWAHYAVGRYVWSSFKTVLFINNFKSSRGDYVRAWLKADSRDPEDSWEAKHYIFELPRRPDKSSPNKDFEIGAGKKKEVQIFISDIDVGNSEKRDMPNFNKDRLFLIVETESGSKFEIKIKPGWIVRG